MNCEFLPAACEQLLTSRNDSTVQESATATMLWLCMLGEGAFRWVFDYTYL